MRMSIGPWAVFALGFLAGVFTTHSFFKDKYSKKADEEVASVVEHFEKMHGESSKKEKNAKKEENAEDDLFTSNITKTKSSMDAQEHVRTEPSGKYHTKPVFNEAETRAHPEEDDDEESTDPYEITFEDYMMDTKYSKMQLSWYTDDKALAKEEVDNGEQELVEEDERTLFGAILDINGFKTNDDIDTVYIRNPSLATDYEISKVYGAYLE